MSIPTRVSSEPEFRWVIGGRRNRLSLMRRLSLTFEVRRRDGERRAELWIYAEDSIRRWEIPTNGLGDFLAWGRLASEIAPLPLSGSGDSFPPRWDHGHCVIEATSFSRFEDAVDHGEVALSLNGKMLSGMYRLEKTPMTVGDRSQWLVWREDDGDRDWRRV